MDAEWTLSQHGFDRKTAKAYEGLFSLGSGYLQTRGSLEEHLADVPQNKTYLRLPTNVTAEKFESVPAKWGTYVPGIFAPHPTLNAEMVNLPYFLELAPVVEGERLDLSKCQVSDHLRVLHMQTAVLTRKLCWQTRSGAKIELCFERFISAARPHLSVQRLNLKTDRQVQIKIEAGIDADVRTSGFDHLVHCEIRTEEKGGRCIVQTNGGDRCTTLSHLRLNQGDSIIAKESTRQLQLTVTMELEAGEQKSLEKRTVVTSSLDLDSADADAWMTAAEALTYEELIEEHRLLWLDRWQQSDVIVGGDSRTQQALRASIYHLLRCHVTADDRVTIDAKGYAGDAYFGRFFWDTEMYLLPFFLYTDPERAKTFTDFRIRNLTAAKKVAESYGYPGARYPWESDKDGQDCCPCWQYRDHEVHVTADVVYAIEHYAAAADAKYIQTKAVQTIVETARYWMARLSYRQGEEIPSLLGVMGPDEYTPISSNNAYTNYMVARNLRLAASTGSEGGAGEDERRAFQKAADALPLVRDPNNTDLILQCEEWPNLADPEYNKFWPERKGCYANAVSQERLYRSKCPKQADVIMLQALFPKEFSDQECLASWKEYLPYTNHDSSLSVGIHAIMALRLGMYPEAFALFQKGLYKDVEVDHGGAEEGIHIAGCGCNWMVMVMGFAGVCSALQSEVLSVSPRLPKEWTKLSFPLVWRGSPVMIHLSTHKTTVINRGSVELPVMVDGLERTIPAGQEAVWDRHESGLK